jgi:hypothetical protein
MGPNFVSMKNIACVVLETNEFTQKELHIGPAKNAKLNRIECPMSCSGKIPHEGERKRYNS